MSETNKWKAMAVVATGIFLATLDGSIVNIALPTLVKELNTSFAAIQWVILAYLLTLVTLMPNVGRNVLAVKGELVLAEIRFPGGAPDASPEGN